MENENTYTKVKLNYTEVVKDVKFANLNKNNTLAEYKVEVEKDDFYTRDCLVRQVVYCDEKSWDVLTDGFLDDNELWGQVGGQDLTPSDEKLFYETFPDEDESYLKWSSTTRDWFRSRCLSEVTKVVNTDSGDVFYVNTEGYNYARYVGVN